jgi:hypothetical protein
VSLLSGSFGTLKVTSPWKNFSALRLALTITLVAAVCEGSMAVGNDTACFF